MLQQKRGDRGKVGGCTYRVQTARPCLGLAVERPRLAQHGWPISVLFGINGLRNEPSHLVGLLFPGFRAHFKLLQVGIYQEC